MSPVAAAIAILSRTFGSFHPKAMPLLTRWHYRRELVAWLFLPVMMGAVEGGVVSVIAKNAFADSVPAGTLNIIVAFLSGAPAFANVTSFLWAALSHGRHKIKFLVGLQIAAAVLVAQVAFAPADGRGLVLLTIGAIGARVCWSGVVTLRSTVWRANYPRSARASLAGKLTTVQAIMLGSVGLAIGLAMRTNDQSFRLLYPIAAGVGLIGAFAYSRMRMRGHAALIARERADRSDAGKPRSRVPFDPRRTRDLLKNDPLFFRYMVAMFFFGIGNLMITAPLVIVLKDVFGYGYVGGVLIITTVPILLMPFSIPLWSRLLDRMHIIRFRMYHCWSFVAANVAILAAVLLREPALLWAGAALRGLAYGGGVLGWNLGHHDFAPLESASHYMGVHVTATGIRGLIGPPLAVMIYAVCEQMVSGSGAFVFLVCLALNMIGVLAFARLNRSMEPRVARDETSDRTRSPRDR